MIFIRRDISDRHFPIILTQQLPSIATTRPETKKQGEQKGIGICNAKRGRSVYWVLCVNTEPCANVAELFDESQTAKLSRWNHGSVCKGSGDALLRCRRGRGRGPH